MTKITINRDNTDVLKLHNLASNGIFDKRTIRRIFETSNDSELSFRSKQTYKKFKAFEFTTFAYYNNKQLS